MIMILIRLSPSCLRGVRMHFAGSTVYHRQLPVCRTVRGVPFRRTSVDYVSFGRTFAEKHSPSLGWAVFCHHGKKRYAVELRVMRPETAKMRAAADAACVRL